MGGPVVRRLLVLLIAAVALGQAAPALGASWPASILGADPPTGHGVLRFPQAVAFSPDGSQVWVADQFSSVVQEFRASDGAWLQDIGFHADHDQLGGFGTIGGLAVDANDHLYVLDSSNDRVQVFDAVSGRWLGAWGSSATFALGSNTGAGGLAVFQPDPSQPPVAYVADQDRDQIHRYTLSNAGGGGTPFLPAGAAQDGVDPTVIPDPTPDVSWGVPGDCSAGNCTDPAYHDALNRPQGIAVDPVPDSGGNHDVFVADDDNHRVVEFDPNGNYLGEVGGFGAAATPTSAAGLFAYPYDVSVDGDPSNPAAPHHLYVADNNNHRVQSFQATPPFTPLAQWGGFGGAAGQLEYPRALAALAGSPLGGVYVADTANNRIQAFNADGSPTAGPAGTPLAWGISGRGPAYVTHPDGVAAGDDGTVYVADTADNRIELLGPDGSYLGQWAAIFSLSGYPMAAGGPGQFDQPGDVAFDEATGNVWVADTGNDRVQEIAPTGVAVAVYGGPAPGSGVGQFSSPQGIAVDPQGDVYVADTGNDRIERRDAATGAWTVVDPHAALDTPAAVAVAGDGTLYVADRRRILRIAPDDRSSVALPAAPGGLRIPEGLAVTDDTLYVSDRYNDRVLAFDLRRQSWSLLGEAGAAVGSFIQPEGVAVAPGDDRLYVADAGNDRVQRLLDPVAPPARRLTVALSGRAGRVRSAPAGIDCPRRCRASFPAGTTVTLTALPARRNALRAFGPPCRATGPLACAVTLRDERRITAAFGLAPGPRLSHARIRPRAFRPARRRGRRAARLLLTISERARLQVVVVRVVVSHRCPRRGRHRPRRCLVERRAGVLVAARVVRRGRVALRLDGWLRRRRLRPGRYRLALTATDASGYASLPVRAGFDIRR